MRGALKDPSVGALARSAPIMDRVRPHLPAEPFPVRAIYFDKTASSNWLVPSYQDLTLALSHRKEVQGFGPWSVKDGMPHVQPPMAYLERMLTVRLHLDDADEANEALRLLPGTHLMGRLDAARIRELRTSCSEVVCAVSDGDALLMKPLLPHASGRSWTQRRRRVLHLEYACLDLPAGLR